MPLIPPSASERSDPPHVLPPQFGTPGPIQIMPMNVLRPTLPVALWPHNFIVFSTILAIGLGIFNVFTLPLTVPAIVVGLFVS
jgi:hypothetical protein